MSENATEVLTGAGVLAAALGFLIYAGQGVGLTGGADNYELTASFRSVEGITVGTDVRMAGVKIGTVTSLALNPSSFFADATVTVKNGIAVPDDSHDPCGLRGFAGRFFRGNSARRQPHDLEPGSEIEDTQGAVSLIALLMKFVGAAAGNGDAESATQ